MRIFVRLYYLLSEADEILVGYDNSFYQISLVKKPVKKNSTIYCSQE